MLNAMVTSHFLILIAAFELAQHSYSDVDITPVNQPCYCVTTIKTFVQLYLNYVTVTVVTICHSYPKK